MIHTQAATCFRSVSGFSNRVEIGPLKQLVATDSLQNGVECFLKGGRGCWIGRSKKGADAFHEFVTEDGGKHGKGMQGCYPRAESSAASSGRLMASVVGVMGKRSLPP